MKCDVCGKPATVEEVVRVGSSYIFKHFCEACAASSGLLGTQVKIQANVSITTPVVAAAVRGGAAEAACSSCGMTFARFRSEKRLGCPGCYEAFEPQLAPVIAREHEGATHHVGKIPKRLVEQSDGDEQADPARTRESVERSLERVRRRETQLHALQRALETALEKEQYEQAAQIRNEIDRLRAEPREGGSDAG